MTDATRNRSAEARQGGCNTFAVPVLADRNGQHRRVEWRPSGPLVPWQVSGTERLWVPVDHTDQMFDRFVEEGPQPRLILDTLHNAGHLVVVSGGSKVGKTTFLHRCVDDLVQQLHKEISGEAVAPPSRERWTPRDEGVSPHVWVVPVAGQENSTEAIAWNDGKPEEVGRVHQRIIAAISKALGTRIPETARTGLLSEHSYEAYGTLSDVLVDQNHALLIILPDFRWNDEELTRAFYRSCYHNARTGIVFFVESGSSVIGADLDAELGDLSKSHATHLQLGPLGDGDWIRFIRARHKPLEIPGPHVRVADEVLDGEPEQWMRQNIGTLQQILYEATQRALQNQEAEIGMAELREYGRRRWAPDVRNFMRPR